MANLQDKVKFFRLHNNWTQTQLAEEVGTTKAYIWQIENIFKPEISADLLFRLADTLNVDARWLYYDCSGDIIDKGTLDIPQIA